jgi:hypothetical protein
MENPKTTLCILLAAFLVLQTNLIAKCFGIPKLYLEGKLSNTVYAQLNGKMWLTESN